MSVEVLVISGSPIVVVMGNPPCIRCGYGDECEYSGIKMLHGPDATVASVGVRQFDGNEALAHEAKKLGQKIRAAVLGTHPSPV